MDEDSSTEQKTWQVYSFGKSHLNESGVGFCWRKNMMERLKLSPHESYSLDAGACCLKMTSEGTHTL